MNNMAAKKTKTNPTGAGRYPRAGEPAKPFTLNLTAAERAAFQIAADKAEQTLGDWIRACCAASLKRVRK